MSDADAVRAIPRARALEQARRAEAEIAGGRYRGPLHGIPYGAKDLLATSGGIPTTWGAAPLREQTFDEDATVIRRLEEAGAVLCAKLAMIELAGGMGYRQPHASFTGPCVNPWEAGSWSGGSSSGSGVAGAGGALPLPPRPPPPGLRARGPPPPPRGPRRRDRAQAHLRAGEPAWRHDAVLDAGQGRAAGALRRGLRARPGGRGRAG